MSRETKQTVQANGRAVAHWRSRAGLVSTSGFSKGSGLGTWKIPCLEAQLRCEKKSNMR